MHRMEMRHNLFDKGWITSSVFYIVIARPERGSYIFLSEIFILTIFCYRFPPQVKRNAVNVRAWIKHGFVGTTSLTPSAPRSWLSLSPRRVIFSSNCTSPLQAMLNHLQSSGLLMLLRGRTSILQTISQKITLFIEKVKHTVLEKVKFILYFSWD